MAHLLLDLNAHSGHGAEGGGVGGGEGAELVSMKICTLSPVTRF